MNSGEDKKKRVRICWISMSHEEFDEINLSQYKKVDLQKHQKFICNNEKICGCFLRKDILKTEVINY
ncbi:hypothetical protein A3Q56_07946 [Intoshia linei]|uniref:Uncharacterized protein n=1 Tax=Intoshia linei TaxID=1819745 RepID=A0A177ASI9_9BILA|nr:hypothetical protein A3Q56_07946 [Intoshia linei]